MPSGLQQYITQLWKKVDIQSSTGRNACEGRERRRHYANGQPQPRPQKRQKKKRGTTRHLGYSPKKPSTTQAFIKVQGYLQVHMALQTHA